MDADHARCWPAPSTRRRGRRSCARREEALDELERRDPAGFARWLAAGPTLASDPAGYVHGGPLRGDPAADTDAA